jgi:hypothetical protein
MEREIWTAQEWAIRTVAFVGLTAIFYLFRSKLASSLDWVVSNLGRGVGKLFGIR